MTDRTLNREDLEHYEQLGYIVLRDFVEQHEVATLRNEVERLIEHAPVGPGAGTDPTGRKVEDPQDFAFTDLGATNGQVLNRISRPLLHSPIVLRSYGHPRLLGAAADLYGTGLVPFAESIVIKMPERGAPFAWHQDGTFKSGPASERGVNFGLYLHRADPHNGCLFVVPESHRRGQIDLEALVAEHGPHLPDSIPVEAAPGDLVIHSRNLVHGSFANNAPDPRVTVYFGFHTRATIENLYTDEHIEERRRCIGLAIRERGDSGLHPSEIPFRYPVDSNLSPAERDRVLRAPPLAV